MFVIIDNNNDLLCHNGSFNNLGSTCDIEDVSSFNTIDDGYKKLLQLRLTTNGVFMVASLGEPWTHPVRIVAPERYTVVGHIQEVMQDLEDM